MSKQAGFRPIKSTIRSRQKAKDGQLRKLSSTMQIPLEDVFENVPFESYAHLEVTCPGQDPVRLPLGQKDILIGRDNDCHIYLPLPNVSRKHAMLSTDGEDYRIEDFDSTNGTFVNNVRVSRCIMRNNDIIRIGAARIVFVTQKVR